MTQSENLMPEMSEKTDLVIKSLMAAKREMGSSVKKDSANPFHKSRYASLAAHLELCEETLDRHGLILLHSGNGSYDKPMLIATLMHAESGQWIKSYLPLPNPKADSQGLGASVTYMRRYSINSLLGLTAEDDDGETACGRGKGKKDSMPPENPVIEEKIGDAEITNIIVLSDKLDAESYKSFLSWIRKTFNARSISEIPKKSYETCLTLINAKIKYLNDPKRVVA